MPFYFIEIDQKLNWSLNSNFESSLGGLTFGVDKNGNYGYKKVGADTVIPFKNAIAEDVNYVLTTTAIVHHLDLANHKELIILGYGGSYSDVQYTRYSLVYNLTDDSMFNKLISTVCPLHSGGVTYIEVKLDISKTFLTAQIYNGAHNNYFRFFKIILI